MNDNDIEQNSAQITINTANITKIANDYSKYFLKFLKMQLRVYGAELNT